MPGMSVKYEHYVVLRTVSSLSLKVRVEPQNDEHVAVVSIA